MSIRYIIATAALVGVIGSTPEITAITPAAPTASTDAQMLTVTGKDFLPGLSLEVRTPDGQTSIVNGTNINVQNANGFSASVVLARAGAYGLKVINTDGGQSQPMAVQVREQAQPPSITIDRVVPFAPMHGPQAQVLHLEGRNFDNGIAVSIMDPAGAEVPDVAVGKITATSMDVTVLLSQQGEYVLRASNRSGGTSNRVTIAVQ
jgi:hypothetical protein